MKHETALKAAQWWAAKLNTGGTDAKLEGENQLVADILRENDRLLRRLEIETRLVEWMEKQAPDIFAQSDILMKRIEIGDELRGDY